MEISHPRRILILASPSVSLTPIISTLVPPPGEPKPKPKSQPGPAGTTSVASTGSGEKPSSVASEEASVDADGQPIHHISTPYYSASVPIWTDRIESSADWCAEWKQQDGAGEVVRAVGAWIVAFTKPTSSAEEDSTKQFLAHVSGVIKHHASAGLEDDYAEGSEEAIQLAIALPAAAASNMPFDYDAWDDACRDNGAWELIDGEASGAKNQFGESTGMKRLLEALQAAEWDAGVEDLEDMLGLDGEDEDENDEAASTPHEPETAEMREPILAGRQGKVNKENGNGAEHDGKEEGTEEDVEELQRMMGRLQAARDMGADLPLAERRKLAARAVREVMRG